MSDQKICPCCGERKVRILDWPFVCGFTGAKHKGLTEDCEACGFRFWSGLTYDYNFYLVHGQSNGDLRRIKRPTSVFDYPRRRGVEHSRRPTSESSNDN